MKSLNDYKEYANQKCIKCFLKNGFELPLSVITEGKNGVNTTVNTNNLSVNSSVYSKSIGVNSSVYSKSIGVNTSNLNKGKSEIIRIKSSLKKFLDKHKLKEENYTETLLRLLK